MIPYHDENETQRTAVVTLVLIALCVAAALQVLGGFASAVAPESGGVAFWAHLGGFVAGVVLIKLFARKDAVTQHQSHHWKPHGQMK